MLDDAHDSEAHDSVEANGTAFNVTVRVEDAPVLAGGPMTVTWGLRTTGAAAYVALGGDRVLGRMTGFSFTGALDGANTSLADPAEGALDLGGPVGLQEVTESALTVPLLVNQFLTVERLRDALRPGENGTLILHCRWDLVAAGDREHVLGSAPVPIDLTLRVPVHRDDDMLMGVVQELVTAVLTADREDEEALARLAALRYSDAVDLVERTGGDPDRVAWVTASLRT
jgi:hypothetical protein